MRRLARPADYHHFSVKLVWRLAESVINPQIPFANYPRVSVFSSRQTDSPQTPIDPGQAI